MRETSRPVRHDKCSKLSRREAFKRNATFFTQTRQKCHESHPQNGQHLLSSWRCWFFSLIAASVQIGRSSQLWSLFDFGKFQRALKNHLFVLMILYQPLYQTCFNVRTISSWQCVMILFQSQVLMAEIFVFALKEPATQSPPHKDLRMAGRIRTTCETPREFLRCTKGS